MKLEKYLPEKRLERLACYKTLPSTNRTLLRLAEEGAPDGQIVIAGEQTAGVGRLSRRFASPGGMGVLT